MGNTWCAGAVERPLPSACARPARGRSSGPKKLQKWATSSSRLRAPSPACGTVCRTGRRPSRVAWARHRGIMQTPPRTTCAETSTSLTRRSSPRSPLCSTQSRLRASQQAGRVDFTPSCQTRTTSERDGAYKNKRIKLLTAVIDANWMVKKAVGNPVPALIGNKLACYYRQTEDMCECTCDVNSSMAAAAIVGVVKGACKNIICDLFLMIEGQQDDELPERIFGGCRYIKNDLSSYKFIDGK